jgi:uncharacterized protein (TIGR02687 family)
MSNLDQALLKLFNKHRIVFWYDEKQELHHEFAELILTGIEKIELSHNEFNLKHRLLREAQTQKFLLYKAGTQPPDLENWLLDVQLAHGVFYADQASLWMSEVGLGSEHWELAQAHTEFFRSASRREALRARLEAHDTPNLIRMKMLAICIGEGIAPRLDDLLEKLLNDLADDNEQGLETIQTCDLDSVLWDLLQRNFGYQSQVPGIRDFAIALFQSCYALGLGEKPPLNQEALVFLRRWKDSRRFHQAFETLSERCAGILNIEVDLAKRPLNALLEMDYFKLIDQRIISELVKQVTGRTLPAAECSNIIRRRRSTHWFGEFQNVYEAIDYAAQFQADLERADLSVHSISDGVQKYASTWHSLDQLYRKFIYHARASRQVSLLDSISQLIENLYSNNILLKVNNNWQPVVDACQVWDAAPFSMQRDFFERYIHSHVTHQRKVAVIISDALRYEIGVELMGHICSEDRFEADIEPAVAMLPSFTQLGMAALLPNQTLTLTGDGTVMVDGQSASGIENRSKILNAAVPGSTALKSGHFLKLTKEDSRALFRDNNVVYIYHNQIDLVGDKRESEERVFEAVEEALKELVDLVKKLANANYTTILVTSDHGFIYQNSALEESDFAGIEVSGEDVQYRNRRFVLGIGLQATSSVKKFRANQLGLQGEIEVVIPKSIHRLRLSGSGSRYVHGGATLQEVVIPVIQIRKKRESDIHLVEVDILRGTSVTISTGQLMVSFFQDQPVSSKLQERRLRAGIFAQSGELISDQHELIFDLTSEDPRQRELQTRFMLSRIADAFNEQEVILKLEEAVPGTSYYQEYKSARYLLRRSFISDFDL